MPVVNNHQNIKTFEEHRPQIQTSHSQHHFLLETSKPSLITGHSTLACVGLIGRCPAFLEQAIISCPYGILLFLLPRMQCPLCVQFGGHKLFVNTSQMFRFPPCSCQSLTNYYLSSGELASTLFCHSLQIKIKWW